MGMSIHGLYPEDLDYIFKLLKDIKPSPENDKKHWHIVRVLSKKRKYLKAAGLIKCQTNSN